MRVTAMRTGLAALALSVLAGSGRLGADVQ